MAKQEARPQAEESAAQAPAKKGGMPMKGLIVVVLIMVLEGGMFGMWMLFMDPPAASGGQLTDAPSKGKSAEAMTEFKIIEFQAPNTKTGKLVLYDLEIVIECSKTNSLLVSQIRESRSAYIRDSIRSIVGRADPAHFSEVDLQTLKRQIKAVLDEVFGQDVVTRVLIPQCIPYQANF